MTYSNFSEILARKEQAEIGEPRTGVEGLNRVPFAKVGDIVSWLPWGVSTARIVRIVSVEQFRVCVELLDGRWIGPVSPASFYA